MSVIPVGVLGATGMVGQRVIALLEGHPWFQVAAVAASQRSAGRPYGEAVRWVLPGEPPEQIARLRVLPSDPGQLPAGVRVVLSGLDSSVAGDIESAFAEAGFAVVTNASNHRFDAEVPLVVPEVNPDHLDLVLPRHRAGKGFIVANANCCAIPLALALAPLHQRWGVKALTVATYQAVSGAGYPGESAWDMVGSVHPHAGNEEDKLAREPLKILGGPGHPADIAISARCVRVPAADGHLLAIQVRLGANVSPEEARECLASWAGSAPELPSCPRPPLVLTSRRDRPNTRLDVDAGRGMAVTIGRVEACPVMGIKLFALAHNTIRGAAGAAIANAELLYARALIPTP